MIKKAQFKYGNQYAIDELEDQLLNFTMGSSGGVIGLSGGIDSTTVAYLCEDTFKKTNRKLHGLILPSKANDSKDAEDGLRVADLLGIERKVIPIEPIASMYINAMPDELNNELNIGNLYSETRAVVLSRYAAGHNLRVMGTGNLDEDYVLGYFTKRGDGAVDNNILGNVPKRLVRELAKFLGVPGDLVKRVSTAGLWEGQTDENELGYSYETAELIQNGYDLGFTPQEIAKHGFDIKIVNDVFSRHTSTQNKRELPPVGLVTLEYK